MHAVGAHSHDRFDILMRRHHRPEAMSERHQSGEQVATLLAWQILLAQAEPAAATGEHRLGDLLERMPRLMAIGDDEQRRGREDHRSLAYGRRTLSRSSASMVNRIVASPGSATGAAAIAAAAKRGIGRPSVPALPTCRSR